MKSGADRKPQVEARNEEVIGADIIAKVGPDQGFSFVNIAVPAKSPRDQVYEATWGEHYGV